MAEEMAVKPTKAAKAKHTLTVIEPYYDQELKKEMAVGETITVSDKRAKLLTELKLAR